MLFRNPFSNRNRKVRLYLQGGSVLGAGGVVMQDSVTIEGILAGRNRHEYIVWAPSILEQTESNGETKTESVPMNGHAEIPRERVIWFQVLG